MKLANLIDGLSQQFIISAEKVAPSDEYPQGGANVHSVLSVASGLTGTCSQNDYFVPAEQLPAALEAARKAHDRNGVSVLEAVIASCV